MSADLDEPDGRTLILAYQGRRLDKKGKMVAWWLLEADGSSRSWGTKTVQPRAIVGSRYEFPGYLTEDGGAVLTVGAGVRLPKQHEDMTKWNAVVRADLLVDEERKRQEKASKDPRLDDCIDTLAYRMSSMNSTQRAAFMWWVAEKVQARVWGSR